VGKKYQNNKADTSQSAVPEQVSVALGELVGEVGEGLLALAVGTGLQVLSAMMEADVTAACGVIPEAAELVKAGFVVVVTVFLVVSGVFGACGTRSRGPGAAPAAQRGRTAWRLARMAQY
jgi:uncharacterized membrane protein YdbT with pleckstrin-like domain